jgi:predicted GH43/DUF377 family glycosyl hydrolase
MRRLVLLAVASFVSGCASYSEFQLPAPPAGPEVRFEWQIRPDPILTRGPEAWDSVDVLNPSVVRFGGVLWNLYSGYDGHTWHTGVATSADPFAWHKQGRILSPASKTWEQSYIAANGSALVHEGRLWYWYQAGNPPRLGLTVSDDGRDWKRHMTPVVELGPVGSWDERGIGDPYVIEAAGRFRLFYTGLDRARRQRLGVAQSSDGVHWTKLRSNPILDIGADASFDENGLGEPAVWASNGHYWMLYTGRDRSEIRRIGMAESDDGVHWQRSTRAKVLAGEKEWDSKVVCDPSILPTEGGVHVWFGGGNVARPDERIQGQIGYAFLRAVPR